MSVYNGARWLNEAISSVLNQTFTNFEFIIVNDGSTDQSIEIVKHYQQLDSRIVLINKSNTGLADSLNCGLKKARSTWIARIDADDLCETQRLKKQYALARSNPKLVLIGSNLIEINDEGCPGQVFYYPSEHKKLQKHLLLGKNFFAHSTAFYRTQSVLGIGGYRTRFKRAQDHDLWLRLLDIGLFASVEEPLIRLRIHPNQISHDESGKRQSLDARIARISYWLRKVGSPDPVSSEEKDFQLFRAWFSERLSEELGCGYDYYIHTLKQHIAKRSMSVGWIANCARIVFQRPRSIVRYLNTKYLGENLVQHLADEWVCKHSQIPK